jgi:predicted tellurium resistance membrane protein TerC
MFAELFTPEQLTILGQIIFIDLVLAGDNAIIIGMVASKFPVEQRKKVIFLGYWWSCNLKNYLNYVNCILVANNWLKVDWRIITSLYCLQTLC